MFRCMVHVYILQQLLDRITSDPLLQTQNLLFNLSILKLNLTYVWMDLPFTYMYP